MRRYYDEVNEEYERGFRDGRRKALMNLDEAKFANVESLIKEYPFIENYKEIYSKVFKIAEKYGFIFEVDRREYFCFNDGSSSSIVNIIFTHLGLDGKPKIEFSMKIRSSCEIEKERNIKKG